MFSKKKRQIEREMLWKARIKELENILCPGEIHDFQKVSETMHLVDGRGTTIYERRYVCKRCLRAIERDEYC